MVAITGDAALAAQQHGCALTERGEELAELIDEFLTGEAHQLSSDAAHNNEVGYRLEELQEQLSALKEAVEQAEVSITVSQPLRKAFVQHQKALVGRRKKIVAAAVETSITALLAQCSGTSQLPYAVLEMELPSLISCDAGVMKTVTRRVQEETPPNFSFIILCEDRAKGQLRCFASVATSAVHVQMDGFSAEHWVRAVTNALGGKGGGQDTSAQGSVELGEEGALAGSCSGVYHAAVKQANLYMRSRLDSSTQ
jgi:alanyl-tRNA synthetase